MKEDEDLLPGAQAAELSLDLLSSPDALYDRTKKIMWSAVRYKEMRMMYACALKKIRTKLRKLDIQIV